MPTATEKTTNPTWHHLLRSSQLDKLGVKALNRFDLELECKTCGERWSPKHHEDGRLVRGYWHCPNRCNL